MIPKLHHLSKSDIGVPRKTCSPTNPKWWKIILDTCKQHRYRTGEGKTRTLPRWNVLQHKMERSSTTATQFWTTKKCTAKHTKNSTQQELCCSCATCGAILCCNDNLHGRMFLIFAVRMQHNATQNCNTKPMDPTCTCRYILHACTTYVAKLRSYVRSKSVAQSPSLHAVKATVLVVVVVSSR